MRRWHRRKRESRLRFLFGLLTSGNGGSVKLVQKRKPAANAWDRGEDFRRIWKNPRDLQGASGAVAEISLRVANPPTVPKRSRRQIDADRDSIAGPSAAYQMFNL